MDGVGALQRARALLGKLDRCWDLAYVELTASHRRHASSGRLIPHLAGRSSLPVAWRQHQMLAASTLHIVIRRTHDDAWHRILRTSRASGKRSGTSGLAARVSRRPPSPTCTPALASRRVV